MTTETILKAVTKECERQNKKWGGAVHDRSHTALDWHEMIADYNGWARRMMAMGSPVKARRRYIQIAALAVAAVNALETRDLDAACAAMAENIRMNNKVDL